MALINDKSFPEFMAWLEQVPEIALDTETTGLGRNDRICGISIAHPPYSYYLPFRHGSGENISEDRLPDLIRLLDEKPWIGWNAGFDIKMLHREGLTIPEPSVDKKSPIQDIMIAAHLVNENEFDASSGTLKRNYGLKFLADRYLGPESSRDEEELRGAVENRFGKQTKKSWKGLMWKLEPELVQQYAESDVELTWRMRDVYRPGLEAWGVEELFDEMNNYMLLFVHMEEAGVLIDQDRLDQNERFCLTTMEDATEALSELTGGVISNPNSSAQVQRWFGLKNVTADVLKYDLTGDVVAEWVQKYRGAQKAHGSYYKAWREALHEDSRIRPSYWITGTYTGRISCSGPNMQAVPRYSEDATDSLVQRVKEIAIASPDTELFELDLSQAELRIASHFGAIVMRHDPNLAGFLTDGLSPMGQILMSGNDLHTETAGKIGTDRTTAKRINFSAVFGIGADRFSKTYHQDFFESKKHLASWHKRFPEFRALLSTCEREAQVRGWIKLPSGRVRRYPHGFGIKTTAASSNLVQGTVAETMRKAMLRISAKFGPYGVRILLQVHDSILMEVPKDRPPDLLHRIRAEMVDFPEFLPMRLAADGKIGDRWGTLRNVEA